MLHKLSTASLSNLLFSMQHAGHYSSGLYERVAEVAAIRVNDMTASTAATIAWAFAKVGHTSDTLLRPLATRFIELV